MISQDFEGHNTPVAAQINHPQEDRILTVARGGGIAFIGTVATRVLSYLYSLALIKGLGADDFGQFTLAMACVMFVGMASSIGLPQGIIRFGTITDDSDVKRGAHNATIAALSISLPVSFLLMLFVMWTSAWIANFIFHKPELNTIIQILAISIPFMSLQAMLLAGTRVLKVMRYSTIVWVIQPLIALVLGLLLVVRGLGPGAAAFAYLISYVCGAALAFFFYLRLIKPVTWHGFDFPLGKMLRFSIPLSLTEWMHFANERTEIYFLGLLPGAVNISIYKIAWSLAGLEIMLRLSLEQILAPFTSSLSHRKEIKPLEALYKTTTKWGFTGALMIFLIYVLWGREIMGIFDPSLVVGAGVLIALAFAQLFNEFTGPCNTILMMSGRSDLTLMNTIILFASSIALDWYLIPRYELAGAAFAGMVTVILVNLLRVIELWWTLKIHPFKMSFIKPVIAGVLGASVIFVTRQYGVSGSILLDLLAVSFFCIAYLVVILALKLDPEDLVVLDALKRKARSLSRAKSRIA